MSLFNKVASLKPEKLLKRDSGKGVVNFEKDLKVRFVTQHDQKTTFFSCNSKN